MPHSLKLTLPLAALLLAAGAPARAQIANVPDSLRRAGELVGSRPSARRPAGARARPAAAATATDPSRASAADLPGLYERFIETCQEQRRSWSENDWDAAANALARLNQRYDQVRTSLPLQDRLNIRSAQAEFHTLQGARRVKNSLAN
ncbi:hypothetical protein [Hymenobacter sp. PAMC 26628]|uniref:hypothetical protein n=1 Tax=Hymenobacter sp. PAMC 26628 TaxID=1484118 RepID=UPI00077021D4|nr:hypothetical protein [Hymenobacter sp. PAMC 26628]AMJ64914.1 hypothetical protein AXW84_05350 [Hymenobacter sp. PAMC 26628]